MKAQGLALSIQHTAGNISAYTCYSIYIYIYIYLSVGRFPHTGKRAIMKEKTSNKMILLSQITSRMTENS